jgi:RimJ/RimL family protein N-acetyltransferase
MSGDGAEVSSLSPRPPRQIQSERLSFRPWRPDDAAALQPALTESVDHLIQWIPWATPQAPTMDEVQTRLDKWIREFDDGVNFVYAAWTGDGETLIGGVGLYARVGPGALEIGYWIRKSASGAGYATEASRAFTRAGFEVPGITRIEIHVDPRNVASARIPAKLGYELTEVRPDDVVRNGVNGDTAVYVLDRDSWLARESRQPA